VGSLSGNSRGCDELERRRPVVVQVQGLHVEGGKALEEEEQHIDDNEKVYCEWLLAGGVSFYCENRSQAFVATCGHVRRDVRGMGECFPVCVCVYIYI